MDVAHELPLAAPLAGSLRVNEEGLARLRERLRQANRDNPDFATQLAPLMAAVQEALDGLLRHFATEIVLVVADGAWAREGIDLRTLPDDEDIGLTIVSRFDQLDFDFSQRVSMAVMAGVQDAYIDKVLFQFRTFPWPLWRHAVGHARATGRGPESLGIPLLVRA